MKRTIAIEIDAGAKTCGACGHLSIRGRDCTLFVVKLSAYRGEPERCPECLAAEAAAKGEKE